MNAANRNATSLALCFIASAMSASASAGTSPYDFNYAVSGTLLERPTLVFDDGVNVYIEVPGLKAQWSVEGADSSWQGPYLVVRGLPLKITLRFARTDSLIISHGERSEKHAKLLTRPQIDVPHDEENIQMRVPTHPTSEGVVRNTVEFEAQRKACPPIPIGSQRYFIQFSNESVTRLTKDAEGNVRRLLIKNQPYSNVTFVQSVGGASIVRNARLSYLMSLLPPGAASAAQGASAIVTQNSAEMIIDRVRDVSSCVTKGLVTYQVTGISVADVETDIANLLESYAFVTGRSLSIEGPASSVVIRVPIKNMTDKDAVSVIAKAAAHKVDIVLRDSEIVLRYLVITNDK